MATVEESSAVTIVGAGPAGLAVAACLSRFSIPYILLEREDCAAPIWQKYSYDRLHLHLTKHTIQLPHFPMPPDFPTFPSRKDFLIYLADYALAFGIQPRFRRRVVEAEYNEGRKKWKVQARNAADEVEEYVSAFLVVATGETCDPHVPEVEGLAGFPGEVLHSVQFRNGKRFAGKDVLVVGSGNSGMEIALDLAEQGAKASIVVRSPVHVLTRGAVNAALFLMKYLPHHWVDTMVAFVCAFMYGDLTNYGIARPQEGPFTMMHKYGKYAVIDVGTIAKIKSGQIQVLPPIKSINANNVRFLNDNHYPFDVIIFATGFKRSTKHWLKGGDSLLNDTGLPEHDNPAPWKGENGLYCVGLSHKGLYGIAADAQNVAQDVKAKL